MLQLVTVDALRGELTAAELRALPKAVGAGTDGEVEAWLQERVMQACDRVVAALNTCSRNQPIASGLCKVPAACVRTALVLARQAVIGAVPGLAETLEGGTRGAEYSTAVGELHAMAACQLVPEYDLGPGDGVAGGDAGFTLKGGERVHNWCF